MRGPGRPLIGLVRVAGTRWRVEERCWYRLGDLAMLAYTFLVVAAVTEHTRHPPPLGSSR